MKLSISNIAWPTEADAEVAELMTAHGVKGVELAPSKLWPRPLEATEAEVRRCRSFWQERGIAVVALQALLYGRPELTLFESAERRNATMEHVAGMARIAAGLGAQVLVFGAPKNRRRGDLPRDDAWAIAVSFFRAAAERVHDHGVVLCIEPNPRRYGCDFVTTSTQGRALVDEVAHPGFGLHLDSAGMTLSGESPRAAIAGGGPAPRHFHASDPDLGPLGTGGVDHAAAAAALRQIGYRHWVSVEMRHAEHLDLQTELTRVLGLLRATYGPA